MDFTVITVDQLGDHIRAFRKERGMSQSALGELLNVGQARIAGIERDPGSVSVAQMHRIMTLLGVQLVLRVNRAAADSLPAQNILPPQLSGSGRQAAAPGGSQWGGGVQSNQAVILGPTIGGTPKPRRGAW